MLPLFIRQLPALTADTAREWNKDNAMRLAAALAYYTVFSMVPLVLAAIAVSGLVFGREAATGKIYAELQGALGPVVAGAIQQIVDTQGDSDKSYLSAILGFLMGLFGASGVFGELKNSLNEIWEVPEEKGNGIWLWVRGRFFSVAMVMGVCFLLLVSLLMNSMLAVASQTGFSWVPPQVAVLGQAISFILSFGFVTVLFAAMFKFLPMVPIFWKDVWVGAAVTAFLFTLGKFGLEAYLSRADIASGYGAAGALALLLIWIYYSAQIFFFGAEFTKIYARSIGSQIPSPAPSPEAEWPDASLTNFSHGATSPEPDRPSFSPWGVAALVLLAVFHRRTKE